jgi:cobaltochelatase CobN
MEQGGREAVILWASDTVRDERAMIAFGLALLGVEPVWNSRGIVEGIKRYLL